MISAIGAHRPDRADHAGVGLAAWSRPEPRGSVAARVVRHGVHPARVVHAPLGRDVADVFTGAALTRVRFCRVQ